MVSHAEAAKKRAAAELGVPVGKLPVEHWDSEHLEALQTRGADRWSPAPNRDGDPAFSGDLGSWSADEMRIYDNTPQSASEKSHAHEQRLGSLTPLLANDASFSGGGGGGGGELELALRLQLQKNASSHSTTATAREARLRQLEQEVSDLKQEVSMLRGEVPLMLQLDRKELTALAATLRCSLNCAESLLKMHHRGPVTRAMQRAERAQQLQPGAGAPAAHRDPAAERRAG